MSFFENVISGLSLGPASPAGHPPVNPLSTAPPLNGNTIFPGNVDTMPFYDQGATNGCGTTSLAMIMTYFGKPESEASIDSQVRRLNSFSSPQNMVDFAHEHGLEAEMYNHGSMDELKGFVDRGIPCQALISNDNTGDFSTLHYVAVVGYGTDPKTGEDYVLLHNPNYGDDPTTGTGGEVQRMSVDEFKSKWSKPPGGFENFFIAYGAEGTDLPSSRTDGLEATLATAEGVADLVNGFDRIIEPNSVGDFARGLFELPAGVVGTLGGGLSDAVQLSGNWMHDKLDGIPVVSNLLNPLVDVWTGAGAMGADLVHGAVASTEDLGQAADKLLHGDVGGAAVEVGESVYHAGEAVVNTVVDAGKTVVKGIEDLFSW